MISISSQPSSRVSAAFASRALTNTPAPFDGIVLAGASSKRFGGADKALVELGGRPFLQRSLDALVDSRKSVVVGPIRRGYLPTAWVADEPPDGGPVSALGAGLATTDSEIVVVLAVDMPLVRRSDVRELVDVLLADTSDAVVLADAFGHVSYLAGAYRREPLLNRLRLLPVLEGAKLRVALGDLEVRTLESPAARDCDSPEELRRLEAELHA